MTFKMRKVFDTCRPVGIMPRDVYEVSAILSNELHNNGNDSYYSFEVVTNPNEDEHGYGYATTKELCLLTDWLKKQGAEVGETVLIYHWW